MRVTHVYPEGCVPGDPGLTIDSVDFEEDGSVEITYASGPRYSARDIQRFEQLQELRRRVQHYLNQSSEAVTPGGFDYDSSHAALMREGLRNFLRQL